MRRAKIVATIGPASGSLEKLRALASAGMNVARINLSHGDFDTHRENIGRIRRISEELQRPVAVMLDLSGPKIRTGKVEGGAVTLQAGSGVRITAGEITGNAGRFSIGYPHLSRDVQPGARLLIGDGEIELQVRSVEGSEVVAEVVYGGTLGDHKGISLPGTRLSVPSLTPKDRAGLRFGLEAGVDLVAQSFVRSAADCAEARAAVRQAAEEIGSGCFEPLLIAKIEKPEAVADLDGILAAADGVMVARGDLAIETAPEKVPGLQKQIIARTLAAEKIVITATQMLQTMVDSPRPTRAEASDVANAILDGSEALMLSAETAIGKYPVEAVEMMDRIIRSTEGLEDKDPRICPRRQTGDYGRAVAEAAAFAAEEIRARLIVVFTRSGAMARRMAAVRPRQRIVALTPHETTCRALALSWGVEPYMMKAFPPAYDRMLEGADAVLTEKGLAEEGESVIVMAGRIEQSALSSSMKIHRIRG